MKTVIVGKSVFFKNGMRRLLEGSERIDECDTLGDAIARYSGDPSPHVILIHSGDLLTEAGDPIDVDLDDTLRIIVIAQEFDKGHLATFLGQGAKGYLLETVTPEVMQASIELVRLGETVLPSCLAEYVNVAPAVPAKIPLSPKEQDVIRCLAQGLANKEISRSVGIAEATTKVHVKAIMRKLGVSNRTQAAIWAINHGLGPQVSAF